MPDQILMDLRQNNSAMKTASGTVATSGASPSAAQRLAHIGGVVTSSTQIANNTNNNTAADM